MDQCHSPQGVWPIFRSLRGAGLTIFWSDLVAGLTLAAIAIPEQMATARLGGFEPQTGFVIAFIVASFAFAAFGGSRVLSAGANSTITPIFAASLGLLGAVGSQDYFARAASLALLVGALLGIANVLRAGWIADLLSIPVMTGFLAGVALHIAVSQAPTLFGLPRTSGTLFTEMAALVDKLPETNPATLAVGVFCLLLIVAGEVLSPRIPGALIALTGATAVVDWLDFEKHGVAVLGPISSSFPMPSLPEIPAAAAPKLVGLAIVISLIVMVQTAATSRSFISPAKTLTLIAIFWASPPVMRSQACSAPFRSTPARHEPRSSQRLAGGASSPASTQERLSPGPAFLLAMRSRMCRRPPWQQCCFSSPPAFFG